jgi:predicted phosphate transport protein (TIGR00153 family)
LSGWLCAADVLEKLDHFVRFEELLGVVMLNFLFKKERQLQSLIYSYLEDLGVVLNHFSNAMKIFLEKSLSDDFHFLVERTHKSESKADDIREEINLLMYSKALIPESREDIMRLLETIDEIPRYIELILYMIQTEKLVAPDFLISDIKELIRFSIESCDLMIRQIDLMLKKQEGIRALLATIDHNESHCDHIERRAITKIFDSDLDPFQKLQLKEMVLYLGEISDQADRVSKRVNIMAMKRRV